VDAFHTAELKPLIPVFLRGAYIIYAHSVLQRQNGLGYTSTWSEKTFPDRAGRNTFFEQLGRALHPAREDRLRGLTATATPVQVLALIDN
jgi:hypothetical protein